MNDGASVRPDSPRAGASVLTLFAGADDENDAYREGYQDAMDDGDGSDGGGSD